MEIKANYKELNLVNKRINENSVLIDEQFTKLEKVVEELKLNWQGDAADIFYNNISTYIKKLKQVPVCHRNFSSIINFMNTSYQTLDKEYAESLEKAVVEHE